METSAVLARLELPICDWLEMHQAQQALSGSNGGPGGTAGGAEHSAAEAAHSKRPRAASVMDAEAA